jgi:hypothetical protein
MNVDKNDGHDEIHHRSVDSSALQSEALIDTVSLVSVSLSTTLIYSLTHLLTHFTASLLKETRRDGMRHAMRARGCTFVYQLLRFLHFISFALLSIQFV